MGKLYEKIKRYQQGFTLLELLVVLALLASLLTLALPRYQQFLEKSKEKAALANARLLLNSAKLIIQADPNSTLQSPYPRLREISQLPGIIEELDVEERRVTFLSYLEDGVRVLYQDGVFSIESNPSGEDDEDPAASSTIEDNQGDRHHISPPLQASKIKDEIRDSTSGGIKIDSGSLIKEDDKLYAVGWSGWFSNANPDKDISHYNNVIPLKTDTVYTDQDKVDRQGEKVWPHSLDRGSLYYDGQDYFLAPQEINIHTHPPGGWIKLPPGQIEKGE